MQTEQLNRAAIAQSLDERGYAIVPGILSKEECDELIYGYSDDAAYRKTVNMGRHQYGEGEYKYFNYPLPALVQQLRVEIYPNLVATANKWMQVLNIGIQYPARLEEFLQICHDKAQNRPTPLILQYSTGGYNALHQDLYGEIYFPMQAVLLLSEQGADYEGGELVLVEQRPRAQSKAIVLKPGRGDMVIFATNFRPVKGSVGYRRVNMRHGVSEITAGHRYTLGIIFHDAA